MKYTFTQLQVKVHGGTQTNILDTSTNSILKEYINEGVGTIRTELVNYQTEDTRIFNTRANGQYYHNPPNLFKIANVFITIGGIKYPLTPVDSRDEWVRLNSITFGTNTQPTKFFQRKDDFGIWPIPQDVYVGTLTYATKAAFMQYEDYTTGTVTATNESQTITGSGTNFTANMVGRWFRFTPDGDWYKISGYNSSTSLTLEEAYQGATATGTYIIGECPDLPDEVHLIASDYACHRYFAEIKRNTELAEYWNNKYWTGDGYNADRSLRDVHGGLLGAIKRWASSTDSAIVRKGTPQLPNSKLFGAVVTD